MDTLRVEEVDALGAPCQEMARQGQPQGMLRRADQGLMQMRGCATVG